VPVPEAWATHGQRAILEAQRDGSICKSVRWAELCMHENGVTPGNRDATSRNDAGILDH